MPDCDPGFTIDTSSPIRLGAGKLHLIATEAEEAMIACSVPVFERGATLVRPVVQEVQAAKGRITKSAALHEMTTTSLRDVLSSCAQFERFDKRSAQWHAADPPREVCEIILSRAGQWRLNRIVGVITTPTIRQDGSLLTKPGYDPETMLFHAADPSVVLSPAVEKADRALALRAISDLKGLLVEFPFVNDISLSVALSALITPVVRGALPVVPLHAFRASTTGTGKSFLVDVAATIATGRPCPVSAAGSDAEETDKRLAGLLLAAFPIACLDNCNGIELASDLLCQAVERPFIRLRPLGGSTIIEIESRTALFVNGNGMRIRGDMVRRTLLSDLDAGVERPELREFKDDPVATIMANRGDYVSACLIVVRAYVLAGRPCPPPPLASFSDWSNMVRGALIWLGCADPALSMETARIDDPELSELREVIRFWRGAFPDAGSLTVKELADAAGRRAKTMFGEPTEYEFPDLRDCLIRLAGERGEINTKRLARWLAARENRIADGYRLRRTGTAQGGLVRWTVEAARGK